jgi:hypothetical protein
MFIKVNLLVYFMVDLKQFLKKRDLSVYGLDGGGKVGEIVFKYR